MNALEDETYSEVNQLLKSHPKMLGRHPNAVADVLRKTYGFIACDLDKDGNPFQIGLFERCPVCDSQQAASWEAVEPAQLFERLVPAVTHQTWNSLSTAEKAEKVDSALAWIGL